MKAVVSLSNIHKNGGMYSVEYADEKNTFYYYIGLESLKKYFIDAFDGEIEFKEHPIIGEQSKLIKLIKDKNKLMENKK